MITELSRLLIGLVLLTFHRQIASWVFRREEQLAKALASRGYQVPAFPTEKAIHDVYFCFGVFICLFSLARITFS